MSVTILESLENAEYNFKGGNSFQSQIAKNQLHNSIVLLEKGYSVFDEVEPLLEKYGNIENVPEKEDEQ